MICLSSSSLHPLARQRSLTITLKPLLLTPATGTTGTKMHGLPQTQHGVSCVALPAKKPRRIRAHACDCSVTRDVMAAT